MLFQRCSLTKRRSNINLGLPDELYATESGLTTIGLNGTSITDPESVKLIILSDMKSELSIAVLLSIYMIL